MYYSSLLPLVGSSLAVMPLLYADVTLSDLSYTKGESSVTITDCLSSASGALDLPNTIDGLPVTTIAEDAFKECNLITSVTLNSNLTTIEHGAFEYCTGILSATVPEGVDTIGTFSFRGCTSLTTISLPSTSLTSLGGYSFYDCEDLASISIPVSITTWETALLYGCSSLTTIVIPEGVSTLENSIFTFCSGISSITIPASLTSYVKKTENGGSFSRMNSLQSFTVTAGNTYLAASGGSLYSADFTELHQTPPAYTGVLTIPEATTSINNYAFVDDCIYVTEVHLGSGITDVSPSLFEGMSAFVEFSLSDNSSLSVADGVLFSGDGAELIAFPTGKSGSYTFPASVTSVRAEAFKDRKGLTSVITSAALASLGESAFRSAESLTSVTLNGTLTAIPSGCFRSCDTLESVTLSPAITSVGASAFVNCTQLSSIDCSLVSSLGTNCFSSCKSLQSISFSALLDSIPRGCFSSAGLTSFTCPTGLKSISDSAFAGSDLQSIEFNDGLATIGEESFGGMEYLSSVYLPGSITSLGEYCFYESAGIEYVEYGEGMTTSGYYVFYECPNLKGVVLPSTFTTLDEECFAYCPSLDSVLFKGNAPSSGGENFDDTASSIVLYYYSGATGWAATLDGVTTQAIGASAYPAAEWLMSYGYSPVFDVTQDLSDDGISVLMEYALNLYPEANNTSSMPALTVDGSSAEITYYAGASGLTYSVEQSSDLVNWSPSSVSLSALDSQSLQTASVTAGEDSCFLRLSVDLE